MPARSAFASVAVLIGLVVAQWLTATHTVLPSFAALEEEGARVNVSRAMDAIDASLANLNRIVGEWSLRGSTLELIAPYPGLVERVVPDAVLQELDVDLIGVADASGRVAFCKARDPERAQAISASPQLRSLVDGSYLQPRLRLNYAAGYAVADGGLLAVARREIHAPANPEIVAGHVVMGRRLTNARIRSLGRMTRTSIDAVPSDDPRMPTDFRAARSALVNGMSVSVRRLDTEWIAGYALLGDVNQQPRVLIRVTGPRGVERRGQLTVRYFLIWLAVVTAAFGVAYRGMLARLASAHARHEESEHRYRAVIEQSSEGVLLVDVDTVRVVDANPAFLSLLGYTRAESRALTLYDICADEREALDRDVAVAVAHGVPGGIERRCRASDGSQIEVEMAFSLVSYDGRRVLSVTLRDITARKQVERERAELLEQEQQARAAAQEANSAKDRFLAIVSHELRNPLTVMTAGSDLLCMLNPDDERARRAVDLVQRGVTLQTRLVTDLLDLSRFTSGKMHFVPMGMDLRLAVHAVVDGTRAEAERAGVAVNVDLRQRLWIRGDIDRLQQLAANLLGNAVKFTPDGGTVRVRAFRGISSSERSDGPVAAADGAEKAYLIVEDTGIGIDGALLGRMFEIFQQGESGERKRGLGIGLALVKLIAEMHGGRVWAESEGVGKGSRFVVELPLAPDPELTGSEVAEPAGACLIDA